MGSSVAGAVTDPSAVVLSKATPPSPERSTFVKVIEDAFTSTTSKVIVASVPSPSFASLSVVNRILLSVPSTSPVGDTSGIAGM